MKPPDRRAEHRTDQCGYGEHGQGAHDFALRHCSEYDEAADRHHHGAAHALKEAGGDEPFKRRRQSAGYRAQGEDGDGGAKHIARAEAVGAPPAYRNENRERQQIGGESELEDDGILSEIGGHGGQRCRDHRGVGIFHEQGGGDDKRNDTRERGHLSGFRCQGSGHSDQRQDVLITDPDKRRHAFIRDRPCRLTRGCPTSGIPLSF